MGLGGPCLLVLLVSSASLAFFVPSAFVRALPGLVFVCLALVVTWFRLVV